MALASHMGDYFSGFGAMGLQNLSRNGNFLLGSLFWLVYSSRVTLGSWWPSKD